MNGINCHVLKTGTFLAVGLLAFTVSAQETSALKTQKDKDSYAVGVDLAKNLKRRGVVMEPEALLRGMSDVFSGQKLLMTDEELRRTLLAVQVGEKQKQILAPTGAASIAEENAAHGAAFLAQNKTNQGVVCLPSGLQYKILKPGQGPKPTATATVECFFRGSLIDGRTFANTDATGTPSALKLSEVIPGLKEALQLMPVGSKWQVFIPPQLGYGEKEVGRSRIGAKIGPNSTLIYELELLAIK
jgi:FKBP-type peptidyl-prolyl cis-trans isomerase